MSNLALGLAGVAVLLVVLMLRVPIGVALALVGIGGYAAVDGWHKALAVIGSVPFELASAYSLSVVPFFILMGAVASRAGMSRELFNAANAIFSGWRGALLPLAHGYFPPKYPAMYIAPGATASPNCATSE